MEKIKILLVDDEKDFTDVMGKRLVKRGYEVASAGSCSEARPILEAGWPRIVILDVMLPDMDGVHFLGEIKQKWPDITVILLTGHASIQMGVKGIENGAYDYCLKPIELDELIEKINIACNAARKT